MSGLWLAGGLFMAVLAMLIAVMIVHWGQRGTVAMRQETNPGSGTSCTPKIKR